MPELKPHEEKVYRAIADAMQVETTDWLNFTFPVEGGRIVVEAAFLPDVPEGGGLRLLPDPPRASSKNA